MDTKRTAGVLVNKSRRKTGSSKPTSIDEGLAPAKKVPVAFKCKGASVSKTKKVARRPRQSSRRHPKHARLVCRYCGSDDLAPSFRKRRDARCRACFKKRYGSPHDAREQREVGKRKPRSSFRAPERVAGAGLVEGSGPALIRLMVPRFFVRRASRLMAAISSNISHVRELLATGFVAQTERTWTPEWRFRWGESSPNRRKRPPALVAVQTFGTGNCAPSRT